MPNETLDKLAQEVAEDTDAKNSAITLLNNLGTELKAVKEELAAQGIDNARLNTLTDSISTNTDNLAAAVVANTPAAPEA